MFRKLNLKVVVGLVIIALVCVGFYAYFLRPIEQAQNKAREERRKKTEREIVREEVVKMVATSEKTRQRPQKLSETLIKMIEADPDYVIVCLEIEHAKGFPGISDEDAERILAKANQDSGGTLKDLQKCVYDSLTKYIGEYKGTSDKEWRQGWNNNNPATAMLFIELPLSEKLGNKVEMLKERLGPTNQGFDGWVKTVPGVYGDWWYGGVWPWPNETPPKYWANMK